MEKYWNTIERTFSDCVLDTYFNLYNFYSNEKIGKSEFFLIMEPMNEYFRNIKLKIKSDKIDLLLYEFTSKSLLDNINEYLGINTDLYSFEDMEEEYLFVADEVMNGEIITVDLISNYLDDEFKETAKNVKLTNLTTTTVVGYDSDKEIFTLGMKNIKTRDLIRISKEDYKLARTQNIVPYVQSKKIYKNSYNSEKSVNRNVEKHLENIVKTLNDKNYCEDFKNFVSNFRWDVTNEYAAYQYGILYRSMELGSPSAYYYDLADAVIDLKLKDERIVKYIYETGKSFKRLIRELKRLSDSLPKSEIEQERLNDLADEFFENRSKILIEI